MKKVLYMHSGSGNHGCEAIIRTTSKLLGGPKDVRLWSLAKEEDEKYGAADCFEKVVVSEQIQRCSSAHFEAWIKRNILNNSQANRDVFLRELFKKQIAISVGGDNYCYSWSAKKAVEYDRCIRKSAGKTVLWACSIDEGSITSDVHEDLAHFDLITAREQCTFNLLKEINPNTFQVADPAFLLEEEAVQLPDGFKEKHTVGVNVSPLVSRSTEDDSIVLENYRTLIKSIIEETDLNVCLIPHVIWANNNDNQQLHLLYKEFQNSGKVIQINDGNCRQLKYAIARCRFFVGARTHATIAAYSSYVPTLVTGYSVKSVGIARDLFGTDEKYVIPVQELKGKEDLAKGFRWIMENEEDIKRQLLSTIPSYIEKAKAAKAIGIINSWR